jgi:hypothetical protein
MIRNFAFLLHILEMVTMFNGERIIVRALFVSKGPVAPYSLLSHHLNSTDENLDYVNEHSTAETQNGVEA